MSALKIALVIPSHHTLLVEHLCYLLKDPRIDLSVFTTEVYLEEIRQEGKERVFEFPLKASKSLNDFPQFIEENLSELNQSDLVMIPTLRHHFDFWATLPLEAPLCVFLHNLNFWFAREYQGPGWAFGKKLIGRVKKYFREKKNQRNRLRILDKMALVNLHSEEMEGYLLKHWPGKTPLRSFLPFSFPMELPPVLEREENDSSLHIVTPGEISPTRKDFELLGRVLPEVAQRVKQPVTFHLLGNREADSVSRSIIDQLEAQVSGSVKLQTYTAKGRFIPDAKFNKVCQNADCFLAIHRKGAEKLFADYREVFGVTAETGIRWDVARFSRPAIIPQWYDAGPEFASSISYYDSDETLIEALVALEDDTHRRALHQGAAQVTSHYTRELILERFLKDIEPLLKVS